MFQPDDFYHLATRLFPVCRSITGEGVRQSLEIIREYIPNLEVHEVETGRKCFDWTVPKEWNIRDAYIITPDGQKICQFKDTNLHVVQYSTPVDKKMSLTELQKHLHSLPEIPDAIPYVTSFYKERWGFCITNEQRESLKEGTYEVVIDSDLSSGSLSFGDLLVKGKSEKEVLISTYTCHPSMANNETSGITVATMLAKWVTENAPLEHSYRFVFAPETIGPLVYMSENLDHLKSNVIAAFNITCVGDERGFSFLPSKSGDTITDRVANHVLKYNGSDYIKYDFVKHRGSDENQYAAPGVDLPIVSIMRTKYGCYEEYHTSKDDLTLISGQGLKGAFDVHTQCFEILNKLRPLKSTVIGEPWYSKHNLRPTLGGQGYDMDTIFKYGNIMMYADGRNTLLDIAEKMEIPVWDLFSQYDDLRKSNLIKL